MIVLDTNIISELIKTEPDKWVFHWFDTLDDAPFLTSITIGEIRSRRRHDCSNYPGTQCNPRHPEYQGIFNTAALHLSIRSSLQ